MFLWNVARADDLAHAGASRDWLSATEARLLAGLAFPARREKWLLGRWAAKRLLGEVAGVETPAAITIANEESGAPFAEVAGRGRLPLSFSISHRAPFGFSALALAPGWSIGADLELVAPRDPALVRDFFTEEEAVAVARECGRGALVRVAAVWSAKEAVLKALRVGLRLDTREIAVAVEGAGSSTSSSTSTTAEMNTAATPAVLWPAGWRPLRLAVRGAVARAVGGPLFACWRDEGAYVLTVALVAAADPEAALRSAP